MKRKIYAILLLLSFLVVLSHQVISHHHDTMENDFSTISKQVDQSPLQNHNHRFPLHQHVFATNYFDCGRVNLLESYPHKQVIKLFAFLGVFKNALSEPPNVVISIYINDPFLIPSSYIPGTIALRGPPAFI